jgi:hypothetical protein
MGGEQVYDYKGLHARLKARSKLKPLGPQEVAGFLITLHDSWGNGALSVQKEADKVVGDRYRPSRPLRKVVDFYPDGSVWVAQPHLLKDAMEAVESLIVSLEKEVKQ